MTTQVNNLSVLHCSFGSGPMPMTVLPQNRTFATTPAANIMDNKPLLNIEPFITCSSPTNPEVIAELGAPAPCVPVTVAPWVPGTPQVLIAGMPAINTSCKLMCQWAGVISVMMPGQVTTNTE